ncbi:DnaA N-terminal domain-containing protein [Alkalihalobacillus sp. BA299]|uniref:DnaA N-terminal domain-containing protein n=1 Tax=Alkalihalobacillus sp. BA299 TaxID=2815938 RepID=UPI001AD9C0BF|nr:DnaA N-terminal domain-containing protein [Alkalihalobacillus sp. BA299]
MENDKKKNLKERYDRLIYYRYQETGDKIPRKRKRKGKDNQYYDEVYFETELERIFFSEEEVKAFSLDKHGQHIPYVDGELTILNNYLFDFWGWYLKAEGLALYGHLKRHAYGKKDWCFPNLELISLKMSKSVPTIRNYLELLERYGFIYKFGVLNKDNEGREESPLYKIRKKIPFLTEKLLNGDPSIQIDTKLPKHIQEAQKKEKEGLPERLFKDHEKYVAEMMANAESVSIDVELNFEEVYNELLKRGQRQAKKKSALEQSKQLEIKKDFIFEEITESDKLIWKAVLRFIEGKVSKPSFDTWFKNTFAVTRKSNIYIFVPNEFSRDWISNNQGYQSLIQEALSEYAPSIDEIIIKSITDQTFDLE